ncbi:FAD/NAD(P)-binding domain-containing protein [Aspergillus avenaceus]|uniref:FAD/NAD(P)-binding domain-containing protein n=1 Tax=Aspergillus avenaceus TaxID=36643 RepID=A0A5N6U3P1_ASPAV|nr:FAD/NAD(P)-binding domain-containing protein [Aspergillus avenaceus]
MPRPCKVIISGGGITGLALALMLEKHDIDYILLEAYPEIVAAPGVGIGLFVNGLRILDQLGCYEDLYADGKNVFRSTDTRNPDGYAVGKIEKINEIIAEKHGYENIWVFRVQLIRVLYNHIADKSKLLAGKRVATVDQTESNVQVTTTDGSVYNGDILVGADGIHSCVRKEMVRIAKEKGLEEYEDDNAIPATYVYLFGCSKGVPKMPTDTLTFVFGEKHSHLYGGNGTDEVSWFLSVNTGKTSYGDEIPRYTQEDAEALYEKYKDDKVADDVRLSDLWERKTALTISPGHEFIPKKWSLGRMIVIGDAAHKMSPVTGQGANQGIETAAALTNSLVSALTRADTSGPLCTSEVQNVFEEVFAMRHARVTETLDVGHKRQLLDALETPELKDFALNKFPAVFGTMLLDRWEKAFVAAPSLKALPCPYRPRTVPFLDELPETKEKDATPARL